MRWITTIWGMGEETGYLSYHIKVRRPAGQSNGRLELLGKPCFSTDRALLP